MEEIFATKIIINDVLNIKDFEIPLSDTERKHLIITGKNGSGKTTVLKDLIKFLINVINIRPTDPSVNAYNDIYRLKYLKQIKNNATDSTIPSIGNINNEIAYLEDNIRLNTIHGLPNFSSEFVFKNASFINTGFRNGDFVVAFFEAKRNAEIKSSSGLRKVNLTLTYSIDDKARIDFIQYIVNLKANQSFAIQAGKLEEAEKIANWFKDFENSFLEIFDSPGIRLEFDYENFNFKIIEPGKLPYNLNQLSDGYAAILDIVTELIMRMEEHKNKSYDVQGIVLIDEIETHLHIELQKKILPFLTAFFPKIQFIVTTHSPFVITSIENAVVCDLEKKIVISDDLSGYSYDAIVEGYFDSDKYSIFIKQQVEEYEGLMNKEKLTKDEEIKLRKLKRYLDGIPKFLSDELIGKLQEIELKNLKKIVQK